MAEALLEEIRIIPTLNTAGPKLALCQFADAGNVDEGLLKHFGTTSTRVTFPKCQL